MERLSEKKYDSGISFYIPLALIAAFLIGCLSVSLIEVRENMRSVSSYGVVSDSELTKYEKAVRKSQIYDQDGLRFRMVSASDLGLDTKSVTQSQPADENNASSASEATTENENPGGGLRLPMEHYVNFVPEKKDHLAYLTFDDGPSENTEAILDILDYYNVKATFFVIYHKDMEEQYKAIVNAGHTIALHSYSHEYKSVYAGEAAFFDEMNRISDFIYEQTGIRTKLMRFPGGSSNTISKKYCKGIMTVLKKSVTERGYVYQDWNVDSCDAVKSNTPPEKLLSNVRNSIGDKKTVVVLMHDSGKKTATTVQSLPEIIELFYEKGYSMDKMDMNTEQIHHSW